MPTFSLSRAAASALLVAVALPSSAATLSVGPGKTYTKPCAAFAKAVANDIVEIAGGVTYSADVCAIATSNLTIRGVNGRPRIDAAGANAQGKGIWVVTGNNVTVENVEMFGAKVPDQNGAALRLEGTNFTLRTSFLHDNENGILSGVNTASNILIENTEFGHNGFGTGYTHNLYIGNAGSLVFRGNYSHDANVGHNLKSRARVNTIAYNRFSSTPDGQTGSTASGKPSYEIDLPNAGTSYVIGNIIEQPAGNNNPNMLAYGEEGATNPAQDLYVVNNTFLNDDPNSGTFVMVGSGVTKPVLLQNNIFGGTGTVSNQTGALDRTNYRSVAPGFVNRAGYDLHPTANVLVINAGTAPPLSATGLSLVPLLQYKATATTEARPVTGALDIGAYEAATTTATPTPTPAPTPTPTWTTCASENGTCTFSGTAQVRYGANNSWVTKTATGSIACNNAVFGDPIGGVAKSCQYAATTTTTPTPTPAPVATWTVCAAENGTCTFSGTRSVRYGAANVYVTKVIAGTTPCTNTVFGDPTPGTAKTCYYSSITQ